MDHTKFCDLPDEIIDYIFSFVPVNKKSICRLLHTSKKFNNIIKMQIIRNVRDTIDVCKIEEQHYKNMCFTFFEETPKLDPVERSKVEYSQSSFNQIGIAYIENHIKSMNRNRRYSLFFINVSKVEENINIRIYNNSEMI